MKRYAIQLEENIHFDLEADSETAAKSEAQKLIDDGLYTGKIETIVELKPPKPDNSYKEENGGFAFTAWGIHVAAKSLDEAKKHVKEYYGKDVDKDIPPKN